jgi:long-chain acyl-CoA synthetase
MNTLIEMLETIVDNRADRSAIVEGERAVSYFALKKRVIGLANELQRVGVRPGDRVALLLPNGVDFVVGYFAILVVGGIVVPLNHRYQRKELGYLFKACDISLILTSRHFDLLCRRALSQASVNCKALFVEDSIEVPRHLKTFGDFNVEVEPETVVMAQFSSGSTGEPKRVARTHAQLMFELDSVTEFLKINAEDRMLGVAPFSHVNGLMRTMLASVRAGATLYPLASFERQAIANVIETRRITVFIGVPFMFAILGKSRFRSLPDFTSLRLAISASAPMPRQSNEQFFRLFGMYVRQLYGSTETGTISVNLRSDIGNTLESVGTPIDGVQVEIVSEDGGRVPPGTIGEVAVKSPAAIERYDGLDGSNEVVFRDGYFLTGDVGKKDPGGLLYLVGRKKFFINKGGYKINPHEIEALLESHPGVEEAVVIGLPTMYGDEKVKALVVLKDACTEQEMIEYCRGQIADFKVPSLVEFVEDLPKTPTGKIRRNLLV